MNTYLATFQQSNDMPQYLMPGRFGMVIPMPGADAFAGGQLPVQAVVVAEDMVSACAMAQANTDVPTGYELADVKRLGLQVVRGGVRLPGFPEGGIQ